MARHNKRLSEKVAQLLDSFCNYPEPIDFRNNGISVKTEDECFIVSVFDNEVFRLFTRNGKPDTIRVTNGSYLDGYGLPTKYTRETLNALLDACGDLGLIPNGVRVFKWYFSSTDQRKVYAYEASKFSEKHGKRYTYAVGKGDHLAALDRNDPFQFLRCKTTGGKFIV